jgi:uncharacterized protein (DUF1800 family)
MVERLIILALALACAAAPAAAQDAARDSAVHLLNRAAWGPRPAEVSGVAAIGMRRWIEQQLDPSRVDDRATDQFLRRYEVLGQSTTELAQMFREARQARQRAAADSTDRTQARSGRMEGIGRASLEIQQVALSRAILSERQLLEVMVDTWTNHFNVFMGKGPVRPFVPDYIATAIRPHALGSFEDLLVATARHPAMLLYLDNAQSVAEGSSGRERNGKERPRGLNENYARELLELHTLGVDGGYTQDDVVAVARILTGWGVDRNGGAPRFAFHARSHDRSAKRVMGREFPAGRGEDEGRALLQWLAAHPQTMRHVSRKLCARFVADEPPDGCIDAAVYAWRDSRGEIAAVVRAILLSPEFWAPEHRWAKLKTPQEFVVSAVRALGGQPDSTLGLVAVMRRLDHSPYLQSAPTGYPERQEAWANSGALFERFNVALALGAARLPGVSVSAAVRADDVAQAANCSLLHCRAGKTTLEVMEREARTLSPDKAAPFVTGLALGSPEFQRQ